MTTEQMKSETEVEVPKLLRFNLVFSDNLNGCGDDYLLVKWASSMAEAEKWARNISSLKFRFKGIGS